jgi:CBS domain containing-hemolysin-like protein
MVDGSLNLEDINERFQTEFHSDDYDSIAGLIIQQLDRLPDTGDSAVVDGITLTVAAMDKQRISRVKMTFPQEANTEKEDSATD